MVGKKIFVVLILFSLVMGCLGQGVEIEQPAGQSSPAKISQAELMEKMSEGGDFLLIDVRTEGEWRQGHIPGATVIPYNEFEARYTEILGYREGEVILYCHVGGMGDYAGKVLLENGFTNVKNLEGGINGWINFGGEIV